MLRIETANNLSAPPAPLAPVNTPGYFNNSPGTSPGTVVGGDFLNRVQEEIVAPILAAGLTLDGNNNAQLLAAIRALSAPPSGIVSPFAGAAAPTGWLMCYGQAVSRTTYAALFAAIGTTYGAGDGATTFNLPDLRGRVIAGLDNMGGVSAGRLSAQVASTTLGGAGGAQQHAHAVSGSFSGSGSGSATSYHMDGPNSDFAAASAGTPTAGDATHTHANVNSNVSVTVSGGVSAGSDTQTSVQPTMVMNFIIRT
jgi:microcystin-dependent protein